jgi:hypothetical protein
VLESAARTAGQGFTEAMRDPVAAQLALLNRIIAANLDCEFGKDHNFRAVDSLDAFRRHVPVADYVAFAPAIRRAAEGVPGVLTTAPVIAFEETGGTTSGTKLVPYTAASLEGFSAAVLPWIADLVARHPTIAAGRAYVSISPVLRPRRSTGGGVPIGQGSDAAYLGAGLADAFMSTLAVGPTVAMAATFEEWRLLTLTQLIEADDLAFVSVWSPTFLLELIDAIPANANAIAARLSAAARLRLAASLRASSIGTERLWPRLACISAWTDASSAVYAARLRHVFPHASVEGKGLLATEAAMTVPLGGADGAVPALLSTVLEFVDHDGALHLCDTLEIGQTYSLIITTAGGLYRYSIGDRVVCVGKDNGLPRLCFVGRTGVQSDLVGEKIDEGFAASVIQRLGVVATLAARVGCPERGAKPHYELWLNQAVPSEPELAEAGDRLLSANPQYAYARSVGQLGALMVRLKPNHVEQRAHGLMLSGRRLGDIKPLSLVCAGTVCAETGGRSEDEDCTNFA